MVLLLEPHLQDWKCFAHLGFMSKFTLHRKVEQETNQYYWIAFSINLTVWVAEFGMPVTVKMH